ncbi:MAG: hypothetical protein DRO15_03425 [Thermoprotei archaeon]|nr:MAG: hypothetical protein DRO15_03425 [Thermoprotei archaeon]
MTESFIKPEDLVKISIAESNIAEQVRTLCKLLVDEYMYVNDLFKLFANHMYVAVESEYPKVRNSKENLENASDKAMEYLVRVGIGLGFKDIYASIMQEISKAAELLDTAAYKLVILSKLRPKLTDKISALMERILENIKLSLEKLDTAASLFLVNPKKAIEISFEISKIEASIDELYRDMNISLIAEIESEKVLIILKDVVDTLEEIADVIRHAATYIRYISLHRV